MNKFFGFTAAAVILGAAATAGAQTVTVAKSGSPDFSTVQAAIDSFDPDPNGSLPNVIQITDSAVYDEVFTVDVPVTIEGTGASRPILACQLNAATTNDGFVVALTETVTVQEVTLRDLILIPSLTNTPTDDLLRSGSGNLILNLENLLVTANNGSDQPVHTDGVTSVDMTGATRTGDDTAFLGSNDQGGPSGASVINITDCIFSYSSGDGLVCSGSAGSYNLTGSNVLSYHARLGIQGNADFTLTSPADAKTLVLYNEGFAGIWFAGTNGATRTLDGVVVAGTLDTVAGIEFNNGGNADAVLANAIIANNSAAGVIIAAVDNVGNTYTIDNVTIANDTGDALVVDAAATSTINITDSILGGTAGVGQVTHNGTGTMSITNSALVGAGPFALDPTPTAGTGTINQTGVITADPQFLNTANSDAPNLNFYEVSNSAYSTAGTGGAPLVGGGIGLGSSVGNWSQY